MAQRQLNLITKRIDELDPAPFNPRTISSEALDGLYHSVERFGLVELIVWNRRTGHVVGGHQDGGWAFCEMNGRPAGPEESRGVKGKAQPGLPIRGNGNYITNGGSLSRPPDLEALSC